jgi:hypothetical protein
VCSHQALSDAEHRMLRKLELILEQTTKLKKKGRRDDRRRSSHSREKSRDDDEDDEDEDKDEGNLIQSQST